jgi:hypothetical protein
VDLPGRGPGHDGDGLAVDVEPEAVIVSGDGDDLAGVDHADLDSLGGDHDLATLGYPPLHGHGAAAVLADDGHLGAVHPQRVCSVTLSSHSMSGRVKHQAKPMCKASSGTAQLLPFIAVTTFSTASEGTPSALQTDQPARLRAAHESEKLR